MEKNEYQCAMCKGIFTKGWSDEDAKKEAETIFGKHPDDWNDEQMVVCDDCFKKISPLDHPEELEKSKQII